jgi:hypothetical protein
VCARVVPGLFANGQALGVIIPLSLRSIMILLVVIAACSVSVGTLLAFLVLPFVVLPFVVLPFVVLLTPGVPTGKEQ